jgi:DMSO/TMAO reductase YedYZ molybdopterin-dependent catalytic subunit
VDDRTIGRTAFLGVLGAGLAGLFFGRDAVRLVGKIVPGGVESLVPSSGWRIYTVGTRMPNIAPADYHLRVVGHVERPTTLTLADLRSLPRAEQVSDFHCVTGWSVSDVRWAGVRLDDVIATARPKQGWRSLRFVSDEVPYYDSLTSEQALLPDVMLALEMDGGPLSRPHGAPARVVMPQMFGYKSVKWVSGIEVLTDVIPGYWEQHGYDADAWIGGSTPPGIVPSALPREPLVALSPRTAAGA